MKITWLGHSSFLLEDSCGRKILTDPFDDSVGYKVFKGSVDIATISHHHFDHDYTENLTEGTEIIDKVGFYNKKDIPIKGIPSYHDKLKGAKRGENTIYVIELDGFKICHLGDLGYILSSDEISLLGSIDVLLIPVGGNYTIDAFEAAKLATLINSHIIIPMHYKTPILTFPLDGIENFISKMSSCEKLSSNTLEITKLHTERNLVKILNYE